MMYRHDTLNQASASERVVFGISQYNGAAFLERTLVSLRAMHPQARVLVASSERCKEQAQVRPLLAKHHAEQIVVKHGHAHGIYALVSLGRTLAPFVCLLDQDCELVDNIDRLLSWMQDKHIDWVAPEDRMILSKQAASRCSVAYVRDTPGVGHISFTIIRSNCREPLEIANSLASRSYPRHCRQVDFYHQFFLNNERKGYLMPTLYANTGMAFFYYWKLKPIAIHRWFSSAYYADTSSYNPEDPRIWGMYDRSLVGTLETISVPPPSAAIRAYVDMQRSQALSATNRLVSYSKTIARSLKRKLG